MIKIALCDDEVSITTEIENLLVDIQKQERIVMDINVFFDGTLLEKNILSGERYDLIYLDIEMRNSSGIETARKIRLKDPNVLIIYVSGYEDHMQELFEVEAFRFIGKPIKKSVFYSYFMKANERLSSCAAYFEFKFDKVVSKVLIGDIIYFESKGRAITIYLTNGEEKFYGKLNDLERELENCKITFFRIHQSYLVSYKFIKSMTKTQVKLMNGKILQVSEEKQKESRRKYCTVLGGETGE